MNDTNTAITNEANEPNTKSELPSEVFSPKRRRGRLRLEGPVARIATKEWQRAFAALAPDERSRLLEQQRKVAVLHQQMNVVVSGDAECAESCYTEAKEFISVFPLVHFWIPDPIVNSLSPEDWTGCDHEDFSRYGLRTRIPRLLHKEFLRHVVTYHADEVEPDTLTAIKKDLAELDPPTEPRYVAEKIDYLPEKVREERIRAKEFLEKEQNRFRQQFNQWQTDQFGGGNV